MLSPDAAWRAIESRLKPCPSRVIETGQALGRCLATPLAATVDMPQADVSAMDGYVCHGEVEAGTSLPVVGTSAAGAPPSFELRPGEAAKIMTGAVVPRGGDRVIMVEQTDGGRERVVFHRAPQAGAHIRQLGEVVARGEPLLPAGSLLTPGALSLLASHGYGEVEVFGAPEVATLATGDELVPPHEQPGPGQLRDSNGPFMVAAGRTLGLEFQHLGIASDRREDLERHIAAGLRRDVLLLSGGVSMGEFDLVEGVLDELGCEPLFDKVAIQPGKPLVVAVHEGGWVFGLPGNPASVMATFWLFVRPLLRRLMGFADGFWQGALEGELAAPLPGAKGRDRFLAAEVAFEGARPRVTPHAPAGSHDVQAYAHGSALVRIRPHAAPAEAGQPCEVLPLVDWRV